MKINEYVIGYDVRAISENGKDTARVLAAFPNVEKPKSYDFDVWPSRFRAPLLSEFPADPMKTNFRDPQYPSFDGKFPVYNTYAERYNNTKLWENLGNMLLRYDINPGTDTVVAFTLFKFDSPTIYTYDSVNYADRVSIFDSVEWNISYEYYKESIIPNLLLENQWSFKGYEVSNRESILIYGSDTFKKLSISINKFGLMINFSDAVKVCEKYNDEIKNNGAYLIFGIYEATSVEDLVLT